MYPAMLPHRKQQHLGYLELSISHIGFFLHFHNFPLASHLNTSCILWHAYCTYASWAQARSFYRRILRVPDARELPLACLTHVTVLERKDGQNFVLSPLGDYPGLDICVYRAIPTWEWLTPWCWLQLVPGPRIRSNSLESCGSLRNPT